MSDEEQASVQMNDSSSIMDSLCAMLPSTANKYAPAFPVFGVVLYSKAHAIRPRL